ncbi:MAG: cell division protein SepF [Kineosporiaceae bacterium]
MGALRKTLVYLGLADEAYEDDLIGETDDDEAGRPARTAERHADRGERPSGRGLDRHVDRHSDRHADRFGEGRPAERRATVTPLPHIVGAQGPMHRITAVHPRSYNDARVIGEHFRDGVPVIMNLSEMEDGDAKRLVDFAAGLVYGLQGVVERVTTKVFLLSPADIEVTNEVQESSAAPSPGFFNQS